RELSSIRPPSWRILTWWSAATPPPLIWRERSGVRSSSRCAASRTGDGCSIATTAPGIRPPACSAKPVMAIGPTCLPASPRQHASLRARPREEPAMQIRAPISVGELLDKITILEIKLQRIDRAGADNVAKELALLSQIRADAGIDTPEIAALIHELKAVNAELWDIEDRIRGFETRGDFGSQFVGTALSVYRMTDRRAPIKRRINAACQSDIVEEKSYGAR